MIDDCAIRVPAYISAGGKSSRFGGDKARAIVDGEALICRVARMLAPAVGAITVVADSRGKYADLGLRSIPDRHPGKGPLAALDAAIADSPPGWLLLCSCDFVTVQPPWIEQLLHHAKSTRGQALAFRGEFWEPLLALYATTLAPAVATRLKQNELALWRLLEAVGESLPLPADWPVDAHVNTPADLQRAIAAEPF